jgi:hypothetical protein
VEVGTDSATRLEVLVGGRERQPAEYDPKCWRKNNFPLSRRGSPGADGVVPARLGVVLANR